MIGYTDINSCFELFDNNKTLLPTMIYKNYFKFIHKKEYSKILEILSFGDVLENYVYNGQNWDLLEIHGLLSCVISSYYINKYSNGKKTISRDDIKFL